VARGVPSEPRRDDQVRITVAAHPATAPHSNGSANDTTSAGWDRGDLLEFVDVLADLTAQLLAEGRLDELTGDSQSRDDDVGQKISFTSDGGPFIK
jgi:hypothetical protein